jgi:hypothetical protein
VPDRIPNPRMRHAPLTSIDTTNWTTLPWGGLRWRCVSIRENEPPRQNITKRSSQSSTVLTSGFSAFLRPFPCVEFSIDAPA